jgi:hypothetical protein
MAAAEGRSRKPAEVREDIGEERERLAAAVEALRDDFDRATDVRAKLRAHLPLFAAGAAGLGFVAAGGIGATARLFAQPEPERATRMVRFGRFALVERRGSA